MGQCGRIKQQVSATASAMLLNTARRAFSHTVDSSITVMESFVSCCIVMTANLCFSFRGLHQKLFRASSHGSASEVDDLNLQYRMQQIGVYALLVPVIIWNGPGMIANVWKLSRTTGLIQNGILLRYLTLSIVNGLAFTSYK